MGHSAVAARELPSSHAFWRRFDSATVLVTVIAATEGLGRSGLDPILWSISYAMVAARLAIDPGAGVAFLRRRFLFLLFPLVCLASSAWSLLPGQSLRSATQLFMTVIIALVAAERMTIRQIAAIAFIATTVTIGLSLASALSGVMGEAFSERGTLTGIFHHKNVLGKTCMVAIVTGALLLIEGQGLRHRKVAIAAILLTACLALIQSQAVTAILMTIAAMTLFITLAYRRLPPLLVAAGLASTVLAIAAAPILMVILNIDPVSAVLNLFERTVTLTGRTRLWELAQPVLADHWLIGLGYDAVWDALAFSGLAHLAQAVGGDSVHAFHNFIYEIWVATGLIGLAAMGLMLAVIASQHARHWYRTRTVEAGFALSFTAAAIGLSLFEPSLYRQHELILILLIMVGTARTSPSPSGKR